jgi:septal ring factor EnvC (AmiA/AmiB activator)
MIEWQPLTEFGIKAAAVIIPVAIAMAKGVARIERTTDKLTLSIDHLTTSVGKLDAALSTTQRDVSTIKERLAIVETLANIFGNGHHKTEDH